MPPVATPLQGDVDLVHNRVLSIGGIRIVRTASGKPTTGSHTMPFLALDAAGGMYILTANGTPGTWATLSTLAMTSANWTPTDASGAGLSLTTATGTYDHIGRVVFYRALIVYPATADGSAAILGGLPLTCGSGPQHRGGNLAYTNASGVAFALVTNNSAQVQFYTATGGTVANSALSSATLFIEGHYATS